MPKEGVCLISKYLRMLQCYMHDYEEILNANEIFIIIPTELVINVYAVKQM